MLLNFWGTWCEPCLEELPQFERLYRHYRASGLSLVAVATDEKVDGAQFAPVRVWKKQRSTLKRMWLTHLGTGERASRMSGSVGGSVSGSVAGSSRPASPGRRSGSVAGSSNPSSQRSF